MILSPQYGLTRLTGDSPIKYLVEKSSYIQKLQTGNWPVIITTGTFDVWHCTDGSNEEFRSYSCHAAGVTVVPNLALIILCVPKSRSNLDQISL